MIYSIEKTIEGLYELKMSGHCDIPHWAAALFSALGAIKVSTVSGTLRYDLDRRCTVCVLLDFTRAERLPHTIDYAGLAQLPRPMPSSGRPRLRAFSINARVSNAIELHFSAKDQIGFLGAVLTLLSEKSFVLVNLDIKTTNNIVQDWAVLRQVSGAGPLQWAAQDLRVMFKGMTALETQADGRIQRL